MRTVFGDGSDEFGAYPTEYGGFMDHEQATGSGHRCEHCFGVHRCDPAQINDLHFDSSSEAMSSGEHIFERCSVPDDGDVRPMAHSAGTQGGYWLGLLARLTFSLPVQALWLVENDRRAEMAGVLKHGRGVCRAGRKCDVQTRCVGEVRFVGFAVVRHGTNPAANRYPDHEVECLVVVPSRRDPGGL